LGAGYPQDISIGREPARGEKRRGIAIARDYTRLSFLMFPEGASTSGRPEKISREGGKSARGVASVGTSFLSTALRRGEKKKPVRGEGALCFTLV